MLEEERNRSAFIDFSFERQSHANFLAEFLKIGFVSFPESLISA